MDIYSLIFGAVVVLTQSWVTHFRDEDFAKFVQEGASRHNLPSVESYDFVIVGGGLAGSVLASSLSEFHSVLVLEIGGNPPPTTSVIANAPLLNHEEGISFIHNSSPHEHAGLENGGILRFSTGKVLGGSSITNGLVFNRGSPYDYDNWANMTKDDSWSYANLRPIFRAVENYEGEFSPGIEHGMAGPLTISKHHYTPGLPVWLEAGKELGFDKKDPNGPQMVGFSPAEINSKFGRRQSVFDAFLKPLIGNRPSLTVRRYAEAQEIILDESNKKAIGVLYSRHSSQSQLAMANKEVIISAGVFGSPKLLLQSGIGPSVHLIEANIEPKVDLPVGRNLQDHPGISIRADVNASALPHLFIRERDYSIDSIAEFEQNGRGPLTYSTRGSIGLGFLASARTANDGYPGWPDIQMALQSHLATLNDPSTHFITDEIFIGRPKSRGYVQLNVTNPSGPLDWGFGFYTDADNTDLDVLIEGIRTGVQLFENTIAYGRLGARVSRENIKGCESHEWGSDAYWECFIKQRTSGFFHPVGSCPMGFGPSDPTAVVDSKLRVIGVEGLRVIDASIMPQITNSNTQAPTLVIAKKAADDILSDWGREIKTELTFTNTCQNVL